MTFRIKQHDLEPPLVADISGSAGDLTGVVSWRVIAKRGETVVFNDTSPTPSDVTATTATITHEWVAGETDTVGVMSAEVEATWPGGRKQTFPAGDYLPIQVVPDLA